MGKNTVTNGEVQQTPFEGCTMRLWGKVIFIAAGIWIGAWLTGCSGPVDSVDPAPQFTGGTEILEGYTLVGYGGEIVPDIRVTFEHHDRRNTLNMAKTAVISGVSSKNFQATTNKDGKVVIDTSIVIADGYYDVRAEAGALKSYEDSLLLSGGQIVGEKIDTLKEAGSLGGVIELLNDDNPKDAWIYVFGRNIICLPFDSMGNFIIEDLAEGTYQLRFTSRFDQYLSFDTMVTVTAGEYTEFPDTVRLKLRYVKGFQVEGLKDSVDKNLQAAIFTWNRLDLDSLMFGGYEFWINGIKEPIANYDTSKTCYVNNHLEVRVCPILFNTDANGSCSEIEVTFDKNDIKSIDRSDTGRTIGIKMITIPSGATRALGFTLANNRFYVLRASRYDPSKLSIEEFDRNGMWLQSDSLTGGFSPMAIAAKDDSIYLLDKISSDTLCLRRVTFEDSTGFLDCAMNVTIPSNFGVGSNLEIGTDGTIYISQYLTTYVFNTNGEMITKKNGLASNFALNESGLFTMVEEFSSDSSSYPHMGAITSKKVVKFALGENGSLDSINAFVYDKYNLLVDVSRMLLSANNKGTVCCLVDMHLFFFHENGEFETRRMYLNEGMDVVDLILTDEDILYLLHERGRIDVVDLRGGTTVEAP